MFSPMEIKLGKKNLGCAVKLVVYAFPIFCSQKPIFSLLDCHVFV